MKKRWLLWAALSLAAVPFGRWLGDTIDELRYDNNLADLRKQQELDREYMAGFTAALDKKREQEIERDKENLNRALEHLKQVERDVYGK